MGSKQKTTTSGTTATNTNQTTNTTQGSTAATFGDQVLGQAMEDWRGWNANYVPYGSNGERFQVENPYWTGDSTAVMGMPQTDLNWTGNREAAGTPIERLGITSGQNYAQQQMAPTQQLVDTGQNFYNSVMAGDYLDPNSNPALAKYKQSIRGNAAINDSRIINQFKDASYDQGAYGGTGYGQGMAFLGGELGRATDDAITAADYQNYQFERGEMNNAPQMFAMLQALGLSPSTMMTVLGGQERGLNDIDLRNLIGTHDATAGNERERIGRQFDVDSQNLTNTQNTYAAGRLNEQAEIDNAMATREAELVQGMLPYEVIRGILAGTPSTQFGTSNLTGTSNSTTNSSSTTQTTPSPWQVAAGLAGGVASLMGGGGPLMALKGILGAKAGGLDPLKLLKPVPQYNFGGG